MATHTFTATPYAQNIQRKSLHVNQQSWQHNTSTTFGTAGDVILLAQIPTGVVITDYAVRIATPSTSVLGRMVCRVGTTSTTLQSSNVGSTKTMTAVAAGAGFRFAGKPFRVSVSDNAAVQYGILAFEVTAGTESTTFCCSGSVSYNADEFEQ